MPVVCPECNEEEGISISVGSDDGDSIVSRYKCRNCRHEWRVPF